MRDEGRFQGDMDRNEVVGAMGVVFGVYSGKTGQSKGFKGEDK